MTSKLNAKNLAQLQIPKTSIYPKKWLRQNNISHRFLILNFFGNIPSRVAKIQKIRFFNTK